MTVYLAPGQKMRKLRIFRAFLCIIEYWLLILFVALMITITRKLIQTLSQVIFTIKCTALIKVNKQN